MICNEIISISKLFHYQNIVSSKYISKYITCTDKYIRVNLFLRQTDGWLALLIIPFIVLNYIPKKYISIFPFITIVIFVMFILLYKHNIEYFIIVIIITYVYSDGISRKETKSLIILKLIVYYYFFYLKTKYLE